jgi:hypothetical protein
MLKQGKTVSAQPLEVTLKHKGLLLKIWKIVIPRKQLSQQNNIEVANSV